MLNSCTAKPRVLIVGTRGIPSRYGGFETLAEKLAESSNGHIEFDVLNPRWSNDAEDSLISIAIQKVIDRYPKLFALFYSIQILRNDLSHYAGLLVTNSVYVWTLKVKNIPACTIFHCDGLEEMRGKWGRYGQFAHRLSRQVVIRCNFRLVSDSYEISSLFQKRFGVNVPTIKYGGCEASGEQHVWRKSTSPHYFITLGRAVPENQLDKIVEGFRIVDNSDAVLRVVGEPKRADRFWKKIQRLSTYQKIEFLGSIYESESLCNLILGASAYIHGHSVGGTNPSLVFALSHNVPCLVYDCTFNREVARDQVHYWRSSHELASLIDLHLDSFFSPIIPQVDLPEWSSVTAQYEDLFASHSRKLLQ
jgi:glycosyltransferase involved in cell wall biosynthesis